MFGINRVKERHKQDAPQSTSRYTKTQILRLQRNHSCTCSFANTIAVHAADAATFCASALSVFISLSWFIPLPLPSIKQFLSIVHPTVICWQSLRTVTRRVLMRLAIEAHAIHAVILIPIA
jgi:hypothetical protein